MGNNNKIQDTSGDMKAVAGISLFLFFLCFISGEGAVAAILFIPIAIYFFVKSESQKEIDRQHNTEVEIQMMKKHLRDR